MNISETQEKLSRRQLMQMFWSKPEMSPQIDRSKCTGCGLCVADCPTEALTAIRDADDDVFSLLFRHERCNHCGTCEKSCPEHCITMVPAPEKKPNGTDPSRIVFEDRISRCRECGAPLSPTAMLNHIKSKIPATAESPFPFELCPSCRMKHLIGEKTVGNK